MTFAVSQPVSAQFEKKPQAITARSRSNFSSSFLFLPREKREAIRTVYAFFRVVDDVVDEEQDPRLQQEKINNIRKMVLELDQGNPSIPLFFELKKTVSRFSIPVTYFLELISGCEMDIQKKRYKTFSELYEYCYRVASIVGLVCMKIFEYESPTSEESAINLGLALQLTNIIRDVGVDLKKNRIYLPLEDLRRFGMTESDLISSTNGEAFKNLMQFQYERACDYYEKGFAEFSRDHQKKLLAARIMGVVYRSILEKIRRRGWPVLDQKVKLNFLEKPIILFRVLLTHYFPLK